MAGRIGLGQAALTELLGDVRGSCFSTSTAWVRLSLESGDLAEPYPPAGFEQVGFRVNRHVLESTMDHDMRKPGGIPEREHGA